MSSPISTAQRTRYESLPKTPGVTRVHARTCAYLDGRRCNCGEPGYRAEAFDRVTSRRAYRTFPTLDQAKRWRTDKRSAIRSGREHIIDSPTIHTAWQDFYSGVLAGTVKAAGGQDYKPAVVRAYETKARLYLLPRFDSVKVNELRLIHVQQLVDELVAGDAAPKTVRNTIIPLRALYRWCLRREFCTVNPCDHVELPSGEVARDRIATTSEALRLLEAVPARDRAIWATAFFAGLRRGELLALDWPNVDLANRVIRVRRSYDPGSQRFVSPKSKKGTRDVGIPKLLIPHLAALDRTEGLVFGPTGAVPFNAAKLHERAYAAWDAANQRAAEEATQDMRELRPGELLDRITLHECRHTYASHCIAAGVNIKRISEWMGHSSIVITLDRYGHLLPGDRETVLDQLDAYHAAAAG